MSWEEGLSPQYPQEFPTRITKWSDKQKVNDGLQLQIQGQVDVQQIITFASGGNGSHLFHAAETAVRYKKINRCLIQTTPLNLPGFLSSAWGMTELSKSTHWGFVEHYCEVESRKQQIFILVKYRLYRVYELFGWKKNFSSQFYSKKESQYFKKEFPL